MRTSFRGRKGVQETEWTRNAKYANTAVEISQEINRVICFSITSEACAAFESKDHERTVW
jgi:hypothetical protein